MFGNIFVFIIVSVHVLSVQIFPAVTAEADLTFVKNTGVRVSRELEEDVESDSLTKSGSDPTMAGHNVGESLHDNGMSNNEINGAVPGDGNLNIGGLHQEIAAGALPESFPNAYSNLGWPLGGAALFGGGSGGFGAGAGGFGAGDGRFGAGGGGFGNSFSAALNNAVNQRTMVKSSRRKLNLKGAEGGVANSESVVINNGDGKVATGEATAVNDKGEGIVEHKVLVIVPAEDPAPAENLAPAENPVPVEDPASEPATVVVPLKDSGEVKADSESGDKNESTSANMDRK